MKNESNQTEIRTFWYGSLFSLRYNLPCNIVTFLFYFYIVSFYLIVLAGTVGGWGGGGGGRKELKELIN